MPIYMLRLDKGHFVLSLNSKKLKVTPSPKVMYVYMQEQGILQWNESSSLNHPEEYDVPEEQVQIFCSLWEEYQAKINERRERMLTPVLLRIHKLSSERPPFPEDKLYRGAMSTYRKQQPCEGAVWKRKDQWWQIELDSLIDLVEFQKKLKHSVTLDHGVLTINDMPLSVDHGDGCC